MKIDFSPRDPRLRTSNLEIRYAAPPDVFPGRREEDCDLLTVTRKVSSTPTWGTDSWERKGGPSWKKWHLSWAFTDRLLGLKHAQTRTGEDLQGRRSSRGRAWVCPVWQRGR